MVPKTEKTKHWHVFSAADILCLNQENRSFTKKGGSRSPSAALVAASKRAPEEDSFDIFDFRFMIFD